MPESPRVPRHAGTDAALLTAAIDAATAGSVPRFAALVAAHHSQVYRWRNGTAAVPPWLLRLSGAILADPAVVSALEASARSSSVI